MDSNPSSFCRPDPRLDSQTGYVFRDVTLREGVRNVERLFRNITIKHNTLSTVVGYVCGVSRVWRASSTGLERPFPYSNLRLALEDLRHYSCKSRCNSSAGYSLIFDVSLHWSRIYRISQTPRVGCNGIALSGVVLFDTTLRVCEDLFGGRELPQSCISAGIGLYHAKFLTLLPSYWMRSLCLLQAGGLSGHKGYHTCGSTTKTRRTLANSDVAVTHSRIEPMDCMQLVILILTKIDIFCFTRSEILVRLLLCILHHLSQ
jgi:hypothetical protein